MVAELTDQRRVNPLDEVSVYHARVNGDFIRQRNSYRLLDLFSGAGGMTLGFTDRFGHNFEPVWANDFNEPSTQTYTANFGEHCELGDIVDVLESSSSSLPKADVVIGGPPCQGFSLLNKDRRGDPRNQLWRPFLEVVNLVSARVFVMENVPQLLGSPQHRAIERAASSMGFVTASGKLTAADYGVPQNRERAFIFGCSFADPAIVFPPRRTHYNPNVDTHKSRSNSGPAWLESAQPWLTVRDAISDLPKPVGTEIRSVEPPEDLHFGRSPTAKSRARYRAIPKEGMNRFDLERRAPEITPGCWLRKRSGGTDLFGRLWWNRPAFTIRTEFFKPEKGRYLHPEQHRPITHREAARFQSFPDSFRFCGSKIEIAKQIGNAVPPRLAARLADSVYALLTSESCPTSGRSR